VAVLALRRYREDHAGDRAAALAFASLLSLLPLLLLALAILGASGLPPGVLEDVRHWLIENLLPRSAESLDATLDSALGALRAASRGLGATGFLLLVLTAWKLLATLDRTFQQVWQTVGARSRFGRIAALWAAVLCGPFLVAASVFLTGRFEAVAATGGEGVRGIGVGIAAFAPLLTGATGVFLAYAVFPGRRCRVSAAVAGALATAVLWEGLKAGFAAYVHHAFLAKTVLAGLGVVPLFLIWFYLSWAVFVLGAEVAYVADDYERALARSGVVEGV